MVLKKWIQKGIDWLSNLILIAAGLVALWLFLLVFVYASFRIPTDSMEPTLVPGDYVLVNKLLIGPRLFNLTEALEGKRVNIRRLPGLHDIQRNDVLVFHFPHPHTWEKIEMHLFKYYVKRCIALPGDTLSIQNGMYQINGTEENLGNREAQHRIGQMKPEDFPEGVFQTFPYNESHWNLQDFGPLYIPKAGTEVGMDRFKFLLYKKVIEWEQGKTLSYRDSTVFLDGHPIRTYRFRKDYYFMGGDNGINSQDSRYWGLLPEEYIVGKVWKVWKSVDPYTDRFRWERFLLDVK